MSNSSPSGYPFSSSSSSSLSSSSSSSVFFLCGEQCCKYVSWLNRLLSPALDHTCSPHSVSISLYLFLFDIETNTFGVQWRVHCCTTKRAVCHIQRQHKTHTLYIIFSVCLHRHSISVQGGKQHVNTIICHLQVIWGRFIWASFSEGVKLVLLFCLFF